MRFMVIVKANKDSEAGVLPDEKMLTEMGKFNEELVKAGVMLAGEGLQASSKGARVRFNGTKRTVTDGPFAETKELIAGFWIWQLNSKEEAIEWLKRAPFQEGEVEIRQVFEVEDFTASDPAGKVRDQDKRLRTQVADLNKARKNNRRDRPFLKRVNAGGRFLGEIMEMNIRHQGMMRLAICLAVLMIGSATFADDPKDSNTPSVLPRPDFHFPGNVGRTYLDSDPATFPKIGCRRAD